MGGGARWETRRRQRQPRGRAAPTPLRSPRKMLRRVDRSKNKLADPLPGLIHEFVTVNKIKWGFGRAGGGWVHGHVQRWRTLPPPLHPSCCCRLHVVRTARRSGKPLMLCVHGFPEFWYSWRHVMREFRRACMGGGRRGDRLSGQGWMRGAP